MPDEGPKPTLERHALVVHAKGGRYINSQLFASTNSRTLSPLWLRDCTCELAYPQPM